MIDSLTLGQDDLKILSIGQMSLSKGMDLVPKLLRYWLVEKLEGKAVHWIAVEDGPLRNSAIADCEEMKRLFPAFRFS